MTTIAFFEFERTLRIYGEATAISSDFKIHGDDAQSVARWIKAFDAIPPVEMSQAEEAGWLAARAEQAQLEIDSFENRAASCCDLTE